MDAGFPTHLYQQAIRTLRLGAPTTARPGGQRPRPLPVRPS